MNKNKHIEYKKKVCYLFRSKDLNQFSIENVFRYIRESISYDFKINEAYVPYGRINSKYIFKNLNFAGKIDSDIFHITGDIHYIAVILPRKKTVLTIHDLVGFYNYNNPFKKVLYYVFWFLLPSIKCKYITVISEKTRRDFLKVCPWAKRKTFVIPDPVNPSFEYVYKKFNHNKPKILLVGTSQNKNHMRVIEALKDLTCELVIVGKIPIEERSLLEKNNISYVNYYNISEEQILKLYVESDIILFPSIYEGFGMPIIEAQKVGRCVITSNIEPMSEVAGKGACLVNPYDVKEIREKVKEIIQNSKLRDSVIELGIENAKKYSSDTIAKQYEMIYKKIKND